MLSTDFAGADIMMALDDVVSSVDTTPERCAYCGLLGGGGGGSLMETSLPN